MKLLLAVLLLSACTDAEVKQFTVLGQTGEIVCYSGGKEIYRGTSTGKIGSESRSDGWYLSEEGTGKLVRVSGDCIIKN